MNDSSSVGGLATCAPLHWRIQGWHTTSKTQNLCQSRYSPPFSQRDVQIQLPKKMPQLITLSILLLFLLSRTSSSLSDYYYCYRDVPPYTKRPLLTPYACELLFWKVLTKDFAQRTQTFGRVAAPDVLKLPLVWYASGLATPTNCVFEMDYYGDSRITLKLLDQGAAMTALQKQCIVGSQHRGGSVALGPDRIVRLMLYAATDDEYAMRLRTRPGELMGNATGAVNISGS